MDVLYNTTEVVPYLTTLKYLIFEKKISSIKALGKCLGKSLKQVSGSEWKNTGDNFQCKIEIYNTLTDTAGWVNLYFE